MKLVLVVEDEFGIAKLLEDVLTDEGYRVALASNGRQALEQIDRQRPDLIVTDLMMPVMNGADLVAALASHRDLDDVPVLVISSVPRSEISLARCELFLRKPFKIDNLIEAVRNLLRE